MLEQDGEQLVAVEPEGSGGSDGLGGRDVGLVLEHGDVTDDGALPHSANHTASLGSGPVQLDLTLLDHIRGVGLLALLEEVGAGILLHIFPGSRQRFQVTECGSRPVGFPLRMLVSIQAARRLLAMPNPILPTPIKPPATL